MLCYGDVDEEEDDMFFDSLDFIPTSPGSASSEDSVIEATDLAFPEFCYNIWREKPISVRERRKKFFREMGFGEFAHSSSQLHCDDEEEVKSLTSSEFERITSSSNAVSTSSSPPSNGLTKNSPFGRIRDLGYQPNNVLGNVGPEAASIKQRTEQEIKFSTEKEDWDRVTGNGSKKKNGLHWWKRLIKRHKEETQKHKRNVLCNGLSPKARRMRVRNHKKSCVEFTAVYMEQEIQAHKGFIWTMKFSPDGKFLATGGEDGIVRIWRVGEAAGASCKYLDAENIRWSEYGVDRIKEVESICEKKKPHSASVVVVPDKVFRIEETPLHEFRGHTSDVLDLSWSKSKCLLSSSADKTVRLWEVGCETCLKVFHHSDYVTCVQFNPADDRYFISGSIDGNIRIWGVLEDRVVDWAKVHDIITAVCYRPDGQGCIVGSVAGNCCFYDASGNHLQLDAQLCVIGKKKPTGKMITGFQFFPEDPHRVMITSADSKVWILDGLDVIHKYKGLRKSGNQMSASFTSNGKHIISVGEDSRVYIWNYNALGVPSSKRAKSIRSCEHFFSEGVLVAIPWLGMEPEEKGLGEGSVCCSTPQLQHLEATVSWPRDPDRFSLGSWFFSDSLSRSSATWPEEKLPLRTPPVSEDGDDQLLNDVHHYGHNISLPATWGTVIVTAGSDGMIRSFHNYGLPSRR
ncbi:POC1 centriolar protein B-like protein isoform X1 [Cinnamomum micranthum f. kanehirae]|uniref:POC1 centriolar protein B-like protein isoform X1 n=1 Tax=Cinnamomum micranthum f. kanehirae TaxID=337451 RepID=A0A443P7W2_9MAGN|nr:POC1 centriolar protein B-like protein isoform X1 [Cinnamomum micranthum f. kanehirae]